MFVETDTAIKAGLALFEQRKDIQKLLRRFQNTLRKGQVKVVFFGAGGVGKTTTARSLAGELVIGQAKPEYKESAIIEKYDFKGYVFGSLLVAPGQEARVSRYWPELYRTLGSSRSRLIINTVCYGWHTLGEVDYRLLPDYHPGMTPDQFFEAFAETRRRRELELLDELIPHLSALSGKVSLVTLVTKQDLWWNKRVDVKQYYEQGEYAQRIQQLRNACGTQNFTHEYTSVALLRGNLRLPQGEIVAKTAEGYEGIVEQAHWQQFINMVNALVTD